MLKMESESALFHRTTGFVPAGLLISLLLHSTDDLGNHIPNVTSTRPAAVRATCGNPSTKASLQAMNPMFESFPNAPLQFTGSQRDPSHPDLVFTKDLTQPSASDDIPKEFSGKILGDNDNLPQLFEKAGVPRGSDLEQLLEKYFTTDGGMDINPLDHGK